MQRACVCFALALPGGATMTLQPLFQHSIIIGSKCHRRCLDQWHQLTPSLGAFLHAGSSPFLCNTTHTHTHTPTPCDANRPTAGLNGMPVEAV